MKKLVSARPLRTRDKAAHRVVLPTVPTPWGPEDPTPGGAPS